LLAALARTRRPLIIVLQAGSAVALDPEVRAKAKAILVGWYSGGQGGRAIAQTLAGVNNPSGRLPVTFYRSVADLPAFDDYTMVIAGRVRVTNIGSRAGEEVVQLYSSHQITGELPLPR